MFDSEMSDLIASLAELVGQGRGGPTRAGVGMSDEAADEAVALSAEGAHSRAANLTRRASLSVGPQCGSRL